MRARTEPAPKSGEIRTGESASSGIRENEAWERELSGKVAMV